MSKIESSSLKSLIEHVFRPLLKVDVALSHHFKDDRLTDREQDVQLQEVLSVFKKARDKYGMDLFIFREGQSQNKWVLKDPNLQLNIVIVIGTSGPYNKYYMKGITIMRKDPNKFISTHFNSVDLYV
jgi:hypothetical protein